MRFEFDSQGPTTLIPFEVDDVGGPFLVIDLIIKLVHETLAQDRYEEMLRFEQDILDHDDIQESAKTGKISPIHRRPRPKDKDESIRQAVQAFTRGHFLLFVDGVKKTELDEAVQLKLDTKVLVVRTLNLIH